MHFEYNVNNNESIAKYPNSLIQNGQEIMPGMKNTPKIGFEAKKNIL
jgi:hypothetical protein